MSSAREGTTLASVHGSSLVVVDLASRDRVLRAIRTADNGNDRARMQDELDRRTALRLTGLPGQVRSIAFSRAGRVVAAAADHGPVWVWRVDEERLVQGADGPEFIEPVPPASRTEAVSADGGIRATIGEQQSGCEGDYVLACERRTVLTLSTVQTNEVIAALSTTAFGFDGVLPRDVWAIEFDDGGDGGHSGDGTRRAPAHWPSLDDQAAGADGHRLSSSAARIAGGVVRAVGNPSVGGSAGWSPTRARASTSVSFHLRRLLGRLRCRRLPPPSP